MLEVELIVFDWDGTLLDSKGHIVRAMQAAFVAQSLPAPTDEEVCGVIGLGLGVVIERLGRRLNKQRQQAVTAAYRTFYLQQEDTPPALFDGVLATLMNLQAAQFQLAVATGKGRNGLDRSMQYHGLRDYFATTRCADEAPSKPDPQMLNEIMEELGVKPAATLMIGDTDHDLQMARNAGTHAAGVTWGVQQAARLMALTPAFMLERISDLPGSVCRPSPHRSRR